MKRQQMALGTVSMGGFEVAAVIGTVSAFVAVMVILTIGMVELTRARMSPIVIVMAVDFNVWTWIALKKSVFAYAWWLGGTVAMLQTLGEQMSGASQSGSFVSLSNAVFAAGFAAFLVYVTRWGFDRWSARATWRRWLRILLVGVAGIGMLPFCFSIVAVYVAHAVAPANMAGAWIAGMGIGVLMTVWLLFAPAPRAQAEMTTPQS